MKEHAFPNDPSVRSQTAGGHWEAGGWSLGSSRGALRDSWEALGELLAGFGEALGVLGPSLGMRSMCSKHVFVVVFLSKVARLSVSRRRERPDPHEVPRLRTKVGERQGGAHPTYSNPIPWRSRLIEVGGCCFEQGRYDKHVKSS